MVKGIVVRRVEVLRDFVTRILSLDTKDLSIHHSSAVNKSERLVRSLVLSTKCTNLDA